MSDKSCMQFNGYKVNNIQFDITEYFESNKEFQLAPNFEVKVNDCKDEKYEVILSFSVKASDDNPLPFNMGVEMLGNFSICNIDNNDDLIQTLLHENAVAIMYPFLRSIVASLTTIANIPPLMLPIINLADSFKKYSNEE